MIRRYRFAIALVSLWVVVQPAMTQDYLRKRPDGPPAVVSGAADEVLEIVFLLDPFVYTDGVGWELLNRDCRVRATLESRELTNGTFAVAKEPIELGAGDLKVLGVPFNSSTAPYEAGVLRIQLRDIAVSGHCPVVADSRIVAPDGGTTAALTALGTALTSTFHGEACNPLVSGC